MNPKIRIYAFAKFRRLFEGRMTGLRSGQFRVFRVETVLEEG